MRLKFLSLIWTMLYIALLSKPASLEDNLRATGNVLPAAQLSQSDIHAILKLRVAVLHGDTTYPLLHG